MADAGQQSPAPRGSGESEATHRVIVGGREFVRVPAQFGGFEWRRLGDGRWRHAGASYRCGEEFWPFLDALAERAPTDTGGEADVAADLNAMEEASFALLNERARERYYAPTSVGDPCPACDDTGTVNLGEGEREECPVCYPSEYPTVVGETTPATPEVPRG